jgi:hypothetical protein
MTIPLPFIPIRFDEASEEATALKQVLAAAGVPSFQCAVEVGGDVEKEVVKYISSAPLVIIMGTKTCGKETKASFSTCQELRFVVERNIPIFLIKMCDDFEEPFAQFHLPMTISHFPWIVGGVGRVCRKSGLLHWEI